MGAPVIIKMPHEPLLDAVLEDDRPNVRNVIYVMHSLRVCKTWSALPKDKGYEVVGLIDTDTCHEIDMRDMDLIKRVDPLRISSVSARLISGPPVTFSIVVFILRRSEPVVLEEQEVVQIRKKRKFWNWSASPG
jgi:hypothetical protein